MRLFIIEGQRLKIKQRLPCSCQVVQCYRSLPVYFIVSAPELHV